MSPDPALMHRIADELEVLLAAEKAAFASPDGKTLVTSIPEQDLSVPLHRELRLAEIRAEIAERQQALREAAGR